MRQNPDFIRKQRRLIVFPESISQQPSQRLRNLRNRLLMIFPGLPVNCLQGIEQEMGIDLILQHLQLVFTDEHLLHIIVLDQPVHMTDHILKPVTNLLQFILLSLPASGLSPEIPFLHTLHAPG